VGLVRRKEIDVAIGGAGDEATERVSREAGDALGGACAGRLELVSRGELQEGEITTSGSGERAAAGIEHKSSECARELCANTWAGDRKRTARSHSPALLHSSHSSHSTHRAKVHPSPTLCERSPLSEP
jgi:hypothetical protein